MHQHYTLRSHSHLLHLIQKGSLDEAIFRLRRNSSYSRNPTPVTPVKSPSLVHTGISIDIYFPRCEAGNKRRTGECSGRGDEEGADSRVNATCRIVGHAHGLAFRIPLERACEAVGRRLIRQFCLFT